MYYFLLTLHLFKPGVYLCPGIYFIGENSIVRQSTNNKVISLLIKQFLMKNDVGSDFYNKIRKPCKKINLLKVMK